MNNNIYMILFLFLHEVCEHDCNVAHVDQVLTVKEGGDVLLPCLIVNDQVHRALWYKQVLGEKPVLIVSSYHHSQPNEFSPDLEASHRFRAVRKDDSFNLTILRTLKSDSGTYFCGVAFANIFSFSTGTVLLVKGADLKPAVIQQSVLGVIKPGSNVTLRCSVEVKMCEKGIQLVYWYRRSSETIHPGMVYTHGDMNNECEKNSAASSPMQSCLYKLPKMNVSLSDAGIYYCAVVICDEVLFGNGTTLVIEDEFNSERMPYFIIIGLAVLCTVSFTINILLCIPLRRKDRTPQQIQTTNDDTTRVQYRNTDDINYAALDLSTKRGQRKRPLEETTYSVPTLRDKI
ncbi:novel immune-type receptor 4a [Cyprinus carpio]|uniref:Novel immune-type receptor 4a n=2 Tax=Cyprinus carpio TaxID=7962 RepID=A0A8C1HHN0_CYPCA|nr:novel immune-type receptor 4a [Cyprinus carpio]